MINLGLDFDDTITRIPDFFRLLTNAVKQEGGTVHLVTSRPDTEMVRDLTRRELELHHIHVDKFYFFAHTLEEMADLCPYQELDPDKKWLWQKIEYCMKYDIDVFFDDNDKVTELFSEFLPQTTVFKTIDNG